MSLIGPYKEAGIGVWTGLPGGAKSYQAAQLIVEWLSCGLPVMSNLEIKALPFSLIPRRWGEFVLLDDEDFIGFHQVIDEDGQSVMESYINEKGKQVIEPVLELHLMRKLQALRDRCPGQHVLVLIDECPNYYASQDWKGNPKALKTFLRQHRHLQVSVVAVAQNYAMLDNNFNRLAQEFRNHENMVKDSKLEMVLWWFGDNFHRCYSMANKGGKPYTKEKFDRQFFRISAKKAAVYSTVQMHKSALKPGQLKKVRGRSLRLVFLGVFICAAVFGLGVCWKMTGLGRPRVVQVVKPKKVPQIKVSDRLSAVYRDADKLVCEYESGRVDLEAFNLNRFYELVALIGEQVELDPLPRRSMVSVFKDRIKK